MLRLHSCIIVLLGTILSVNLQTLALVESIHASIGNIDLPPTTIKGSAILGANDSLQFSPGTQGPVPDEEIECLSWHGIGMMKAISPCMSCTSVCMSVT